ncbi:CtsR family transcriptional regulator [Suicoccus acidiformans]|uniref:Transcriptional regulator CtsR n=1 Tax=Suicoccus acidiformans TaxID=2036206 RepID=A0A347WHL2_9LACT|nr:CtsR family transcriptional regulator [Suicoccus acidiformans]AXY24569.1 CtsR family transcriptional regulator [Suicoccus acidiformans]
MAKRNMSDIIESYLKSFLKTQQELEIKRSDIAEQFDCVPSQINYVINTRFTQEHGYMVESKRGGGGYIRILKIELVQDVDAIDQMMELVGPRINERSASNIIETLAQHDIITNREAILITSILEKELLSLIADDAATARSVMLREILGQLRINHTTH